MPRPPARFRSFRRFLSLRTGLRSSDPVPDTRRLVEQLLQLAEGLSTSEDLDVQLYMVCRSTTILLGCDRSSIFLFEAGAYRARCNYGNPPDIARSFPKHRVRVDDPLIARAVSSRSFAVANDAKHDEAMDRRTAETARIRAITVAPMLRGERPIGFITAEFNENPGEFSELDSTLLLCIAKLTELVVQYGEARAESRRLAEELREAHRYEGLARLVGGVAHDFNNCLTVILGVAGLMADEHRLASLEADIRDLQSSAERAAALTRRLQNFTRPSLETGEPVDSVQALAELEIELRRITPSDLDLELAFDVSTGARGLACTPAEFEQIATALALTAALAAPSRTTLTLRLAEVRIDDATAIELPGLRPGPHVVLSVRNSAAGLPLSGVPRPFDPASAAARSMNDVGAALSDVVLLVASLGGHLKVGSATDLETEVSVYLPASEMVRPGAPLASSGARLQRGAPATILVVDDDEPVRRMMASALRASGSNEVIEAVSAEQAIELSGAYAGKIDLLVSDVVMPEASGRELADELRRQRPGLAVLLVSGYSLEFLEKRDLEVGGYELLPKPFSRARLAQKVSAVLTSNGPLDSATS